MENNQVSFYLNPYFDDLIGFLKVVVPTSQDKFKPVQCAECGKNLYEAKDKANKTDFVELIKSQLKKEPNQFWPYKSNLFIQISISDSKSKITQIDIDNLIKTIFDSLKGVAFNDDSQIVAVYASKFYFEEFNMPGFTFGIKELIHGESPVTQDYLWSQDENFMKELRIERSKSDKPQFAAFIDMSPEHDIVFL